MTVVDTLILQFIIVVLFLAVAYQLLRSTNLA